MDSLIHKWLYLGLLYSGDCGCRVVDSIVGCPVHVHFPRLELLWMFLDMWISTLSFLDGCGVELFMDVYVYELVTLLYINKITWCYNLTYNLIILLCSMNDVVNTKASFCLMILLLCVFPMYNICVVG